MVCKNEVSNFDKRNSVNICSLAEDIKDSHTGYNISVRELDSFVRQLIAERISEAMVLHSKLVSGNDADDLWNQVVLLQHEICKVDLQIEQQKFLIESLEPNVQKKIITLQESKELRLAFESKQSELMKVRNQFLEKIQRIRATITLDCR